MGGCVSTRNKNGAKEGKGKRSAEEQLCCSIKVIKEDGKLEEFKQPVKASYILSSQTYHGHGHGHGRDLFLCSSDSMSIGNCVPQLPHDEELQVGHIYFLLPLSIAHHPLSLPHLCALAIKASSALPALHFSSSALNSNLIFQ